ncbi:MAG TPA: thioredoxin-like domain-containing protein [Acidimicrobiales bacterium]|nr:thioredoxin-like domain-containing protein [Acidimicrobiales bacterium]
MPARVRAPQLSGDGGWIGTPSPLSLKALQGKVVLLHFWTYSCVNCLGVIEELRRIERRFSEELVVVGVHSPRFPHEGKHQSVEQAVGRHRIAHPVLDDPSLTTWKRYGIRAWPTLVLIDPKGYVVGALSGEGHGRELTKVIAELVARHEGKGTLATEPIDVDPVTPDGGLLAFPGNVAVSADGTRLAIADTAHDQVLVCTTGGLVLEAHTGLARPQGVRFDGTAVMVCDTGANRVVRTDGVVLADGLSSPWDVVMEDDGSLVIAEAGRHRLARVRPGEQRVLVAAGTGEQGMEDGPCTQALLAQPSGVTRTPGGIVFVDADASALRVLTKTGDVVTLVGQGPSHWGAEDGAPHEARLQHPLGVAASRDGQFVYVADTFNSVLRVWDGEALRTLAVEGLDEPGGLDVLTDGRLVVADTNHHRVLVVDPHSEQAEPLELDDSWLMSTTGPALSARSGELLPVDVSMPLAEEELDISTSEPVRVSIEARPAPLLAEGASQWSLPAAEGRVEPRAGDPGEGLLLVEVVATTRGVRGPAERVRRVHHILQVH